MNEGICKQIKEIVLYQNNLIKIKNRLLIIKRGYFDMIIPFMGGRN